MARPNPEETWVNYVESWKTNLSSGQNSRSGRSKYRSYSSTNTPGFPRTKRWNAYSMYYAFGTRSASLRVYDTWVGRPDLGWGDSQLGWYSAGLSHALLDDVQHSSNLLYRAKMAHQDEIAHRSINLAQAFAERRQVVDMITNTAKRIARSLRLVRRGNIVAAARSLGLNSGHKPTGSVASDWLALQYGWKPLLSDVYGACETLAYANYHRPWRIETLTKRSERSYENLDITFFPGPYAVPGKYERFTTSKVRLESVYEVSNELIRAGGQTGVTDPLTLAWELLPYSFVVDWFVPIGNFLSRLRFDDGLTFVSALQTRTSTMSGAYKPRGSNLIPSGGRVLSRSVSGSIASNAIRMDRQIITSLHVDLPRFKDPFSLTHVLNALALVRVAAGR